VKQIWTTDKSKYNPFYYIKTNKNGYSSKQIAEMLGIQEQTLKHYVQEK